MEYIDDSGVREAKRMEAKEIAILSDQDTAFGVRKLQMLFIGGAE